MTNPHINAPTKLATFVFCLLLSFPAFSCLGQTEQSTEPVKESSFGKSLVAGKFILPAKDGWWNWGMAPIYDDQGRLHIFNSSIPFKGEHGMGFWQSKSIINHYVGDSIEGPFELLGTAFSSDERTYHNPQISKAGDTYVLVFLWKSVEQGSLQSIGMATAKSLDGPWTENKDNPIIRPTAGTPNSAHASNPTFLVDREGKFRIYYKSMTKGSGLREISVAIADKLVGPYVDSPKNPLISYKEIERDIEDPYAFFYEDNYYFGKELSRSERPHILWKDGKPEFLLLANHGSREAGFYLKIKDWKVDQ